MSNLSFDVTVNSSDFLEKTEQIRSAIRATALEMDQQGKKVGSSFQQMADSATLSASVVEMVIKDMQKQISAAIASLSKLDAENKARLSGLKNDLGKHSESGSGEDGRSKSVSNEIDSRETLSTDINNQYNELVLLDTELLNYRSKLEAIQNETSALASGISSACEGMEDMRDEIRQTVETYVELIDKSKSLSNSMNEADKGSAFEGMIMGLNGLSGAFTVGSSMLEMFSMKSETLQTVMQKVQQAISITNGLQEVNAMLTTAAKMVTA